MHDDPFQTRERGVRRVRTVTASLAAASLLGTGAIVYELAAPASAATQTSQTGTGDQQQQQPGSGDDGQLEQQPPGYDNGGTVQPPAQAPTPGGQRGQHASSGGS